MKKTIFSLLFCISIFQFNAQEIKTGDIIVFIAPISVKNTEQMIEGKTDENEPTYLDANIKFRVVSIDTTEVRVISLLFSAPNDSKQKKMEKNNEVSKSQIYNNRIFTVELDIFNLHARQFTKTDGLSIGIISLPFKARVQKTFSYDTEFNLNSVVNIKLPFNWRITPSFQFGAGIGSVNLDNSNSSIPDSLAQDISTLTCFGGFMFKGNDSRAQIGIYLGFDFINKQPQYHWYNQGEPWIGFGIGYNIFDIPITSSTPKN